MNNKNIVLIGFMGCGKTTIGKVLAAHLQYCFIDTDEQIVTKEGKSIPFIFEHHGEHYFREAESNVLRGVMNNEKQVVATGGGIVTISANIPLLDRGIVIYLKASPEQIYKNIKEGNGRPLLQTDDVYGKVCTMLESRKMLYEKVAHHTIVVDGKTPQYICNEIVSYLKENQQ